MVNDEVGTLNSQNWKALFQLALALPQRYRNAQFHCQYDLIENRMVVNCLAADDKHVTLYDDPEGFPSDRLVAQLILILPHDPISTYQG